MDKTRRKLLADRLDAMDMNERQKLHKRATKLLKATQKHPGPQRLRQRGAGRWDEEDAPRHKPMKSTSVNVKDLMLQLLDDEQEPRSDDDTFEGVEETCTAVVTCIYPGSCQASADGELLDCLLPPALVQMQQTDLAVGDEVRIAQRSEDTWSVLRVLPRRTRLSRPDPANPHLERVIVANVDAVVVVVSVRTPPLRPRLIDRYLIAIGRGGAEPVLCVNKLDLLDSEQERREELEILRPYRDLGIPVLPCSAAKGSGMEELRGILAGKLCAFVGHSGVGKSSLLNALAPELGLRTNSLREGDGKGRHTTSASTLHELADGIRIIDTPGIRGFGVWKMGPEELHRHFPEFEEPAQECRFGDCTHTQEPGCAVQQAVEEGRLTPVRFEAYLRILQSLED